MAYQDARSRVDEWEYGTGSGIRPRVSYTASPSVPQSSAVSVRVRVREPSSILQICAQIRSRGCTRTLVIFRHIRLLSPALSSTVRAHGYSPPPPASTTTILLLSQPSGPSARVHLTAPAIPLPLFYFSDVRGFIVNS